ncbi:MAG: hypothetical protein JSV88_00130 [Candidatus Aminicenantes bacterium]|nr:MAG: hypothetical protein JSV88_00130 [Candidatus Aminicenantes bacterium]
MRKIDKTNILSVQYKKWLDKLNRDKVKHPQSSTYYDDVVMNLLHCQKGICAYTEMSLCNPGLLDEDNWKKGRYNKKRPEPIGELDHFDPKLKKNKYWEWENLFVVLERINRKKGSKEVDYILKPDSSDYDPMVLLEYNEKYHIFIPHTEIEDEAIRKRIHRMIEVLHINYDFVCRERRRFLKVAFKSREMEAPVEIDRFFTAYQMAVAAKEKGG